MNFVGNLVLLHIKELVKEVQLSLTAHSVLAQFLYKHHSFCSLSIANADIPACICTANQKCSLAACRMMSNDLEQCFENLALLSFLARIKLVIDYQTLRSGMGVH